MRRPGWGARRAARCGRTARRKAEQARRQAAPVYVPDEWLDGLPRRVPVVPGYVRPPAPEPDVVPGMVHVADDRVEPYPRWLPWVMAAFGFYAICLAIWTVAS